MFECEDCKKITEKREKCNIISVEFRPKKYRNSVTKLINGEKTIRTFETKGSEIAKEKKICSFCLNKTSRPKTKLKEYVRNRLPYDIEPTYVPWTLSQEDLILLSKLKI